MRVSKGKYLERVTSSKKNSGAKATYRDWWIVKNTSCSQGISLGYINFPKCMLGKKVKFKVVVVTEKKFSKVKKKIAEKYDKKNEEIVKND